MTAVWIDMRKRFECDVRQVQNFESNIILQKLYLAKAGWKAIIT